MRTKLRVKTVRYVYKSEFYVSHQEHYPVLILEYYETAGLNVC